MKRRASFDIVVPVRNSLDHARQCVESIILHATPPARLWIIDDCSDRAVRESLERETVSWQSRWPAEPARDGGITSIRNDRALGFPGSCNEAATRGRGEILLFLHSDTIVFADYLERLEEVFERDSSIAMVNPSSTSAGPTHLPFPSGFNILEVDAYLRGRDDLRGREWDIRAAAGFCLAIRRSVFEELGGFDPGHGSDGGLSFRAIRAGHRAVAAPGIYVFHQGSGGSRLGRLPGSGTEERPGEPSEETPPATPPYDRLNAELSEPGLSNGKDAWDPSRSRVGRESARLLVDAMLGSPREALRMAAGAARAPAPPRNGKVLYLLPGMKLYGGVVSVLQLVNRLILEGIDANVAVIGEIDEAVFDAVPMYFRPYRFATEEDLIAELPPAETVVATAWRTAFTATAIRFLYGSKLLYFVQDYEPDFHDDDPRQRARAELTYSLITERIVKSRWLRSRLLPFGGHTRLVPLGLDTDVFREREIPRALQIIGMARPGSRYRNFEMLMRVYATLAGLRPELRLATFGFEEIPPVAGVPLRNYGPLHDPRRVAEALCESTVLLDCSIFQGFGRPGLEAMACGTATVLTRAGGITQYARHRGNCLLVDPTDHDEIVGACLEIVDDEKLRRALVEAGLSTASEYSHVIEGRRTVEVIRAISSGI